MSVQTNLINLNIYLINLLTYSFQFIKYQIIFKENKYTTLINLNIFILPYYFLS